MKGPGWRAPSVGTRLSVVIALRPEGAGTRAPVRGARNRGAGHLDHACYIKRSRGAHAFALISVLKDMLNRFMVAVESPLMRELPPLAARTYAFRRNSSFRDTARCSE